MTVPSVQEIIAFNGLTQFFKWTQNYFSEIQEQFLDKVVILNLKFLQVLKLEPFPLTQKIDWVQNHSQKVHYSKLIFQNFKIFFYAKVEEWRHSWP